MPALAVSSPPAAASAAPSPRPASAAAGVAPSWAAAARGAWLWDAHGQRRLDMTSGGGAVVLGHADPDVERAASRAGPASQALATARLLQRLRCADAVRFTTDVETARAAAIAACRTATSRPSVMVVATLEDAADAPARLAAGDVAAVLVDPSATPFAIPSALRALTAAAGAFLVFDETATDLRRHTGGMQAMLGVRADLALFGRGLANGRPLAAIAGRDAAIAALPATPAPDVASLAAAAETLQKVEVEAAPLAIAICGAEIQAELGDRLRRSGADAFARLDGDPSACRLLIDHPDARNLERRFSAQLAARGVHGGAVSLPSLAHADEAVDALLEAWTGALPSLTAAAARSRA